LSRWRNSFGWQGGPEGRKEAMIAVVRDAASSGDQLTEDLRAAYQRVSAAGTTNPILLVFLAPGVAPPVRAVIVGCEDELVAASATPE
jgi:hypothetical protein